MTQMVLCPKMKYKYVSTGSLPRVHFATKCYLETKAQKCGIKMRNQSTRLTNIIASSGRRTAIASILNHITAIHHLYELLCESLASTVDLNFQQRPIGNASSFFGGGESAIKHIIIQCIMVFRKESKTATKSQWLPYWYHLEAANTLFFFKKRSKTQLLYNSFIVPYIYVWTHTDENNSVSLIVNILTQHFYNPEPYHAMIWLNTKQHK